MGERAKETYSTARRRVSVKEVEDEDDLWDKSRIPPPGNILLEGIPSGDHTGEPTRTPAEELNPPTEMKEHVKLAPRVAKPWGQAAEGVLVVATCGRLGGLDEHELDLRLNLGASVTLISQEYLRTLKQLPKLRQEAKMCLHYLTNKDARLENYVHVPVFMNATDGLVIETLAEAYVVPNMMVPILLGEDYHQTYEIGVS
ncbi:hypothetical protein HYDPIDRAFT_171209 [Hydnomerulius pinastri MD-312]|uniref:Uncharacterized protein n=1 Tax=Hydnomerulius pinastri MD-312 TaxID=994086 RepID=A0A0C9W743_9AGAM|nr:hypothetical protein HYDPIDRAFT_171209 [Hydnomerulius pinastri MD-312]